MISQCGSHQGPVSISSRTSYPELSWSLEAKSLLVYIIQSLWHLSDCRCACQISYRLYNFKYKFRRFETSRDLTIRRLIGYWIQIRKSKDYVYGIWVYKALDIWKGYYRVKKSLVSYVKPWTEGRNNKYMKYHSKLTYQLSFWNVSRKVDYHAGGKWFIHGPKRRKENQLLSLKHSCWLSLV